MKLKKVFETITDMLLNFKMISRPQIMITILLVSILIWVGEAGLFYFILLGDGVYGSLQSAVLVMALSTLSTLAPSSPGYIGPFHLAAFTAISLAGGNPEEAGSFAVIVHLCLWLPTTFAGFLSILARPDLFYAVMSRKS